MTAPPAGMPDAFVRLRASGWIISLCLHGGAVFLATLFAAKIRLAPPSSSFQWDVTVVTPSASTPTLDKPQVASTPARMTPQSTPIPSPRPAAADVQHSRKSVPSSRTSTYEPLTPTPVFPSPPQNIESAPQRSLARPLPEVVEAPRPEPVTEPSPAPVVPSQEEVHPQQAPVTSPAKEYEAPDPPTSPFPAAQPSTEQPPAPTSTAALAPTANNVPAPRKVDYGWLAGILLPRIEALKEYPVDARLKHVEGRVVVRIVIQEDGQIVSAAVAKSSGHDTLDQAALETIRKASPITLTQPLGKSSVTIQIPLGYFLDR